MSKWKMALLGDGRCYIIDETASLVVPPGMTQAIAKQIVLEHNAHAALLAACKGMIADDIVAAREELEYGPGGTGPEIAADDLIDEREDAVRAAIAKSEATP